MLGGATAYRHKYTHTQTQIHAYVDRETDPPTSVKPKPLLRRINGVQLM